MVSFVSPSGQTLNVTLPEGCIPGGKLQVTAPAVATTSGSGVGTLTKASGGGSGGAAVGAAERITQGAVRFDCCGG